MTFNDQFVCSGTLIAPTVFLTAGHCADFLKVPSQGQGWVTFDEDGQGFPEDVPIDQAYTYPGFCVDDGFTVPDCPGHGVLGSAQYDVGIVVLATGSDHVRIRAAPVAGPGRWPPPKAERHPGRLWHPRAVEEADDQVYPALPGAGTDLSARLGRTGQGSSIASLPTRAAARVGPVSATRADPTFWEPAGPCWACTRS